MAPLTTPTITIRPSYADDQQALVRLATLDSAPASPAVRCCSPRSTASFARRCR